MQECISVVANVSHIYFYIGQFLIASYLVIQNKNSSGNVEQLSAICINKYQKSIKQM